MLGVVLSYLRQTTSEEALVPDLIKIEKIKSSALDLWILSNLAA
jgi:hypothetical protein